MYFIYVHFSKQALFVAVRLCFFDGAVALRDACLSWLSAPEGRLRAWQQARALTLREASAEMHGALWLGWIAERVTKVDGGHPSWAALSQLFASVLQHRDDVALSRP